MKTLDFLSSIEIENIVTTALENPIITNSEGIKLNIENMTVDKIYHCVYNNKIFIFYKDQAECLHCYEIGDQKLCEEILKNPDDCEKILESYGKKLD
ncbi:MAG: hypothetical protein DA328_03200 [Nitrososphaeraceae archaeon]|nr:hypothetical protein [Nitrososphaeraceae archaeon]